jgi:hypothetical protein
MTYFKNLNDVIMKNLGFKITVEFYCYDMIDEESFKEDFDSNPTKAYECISDEYQDSIENFTNESKIIKIELMTENDNIPF